ncbi:MAG: hypothetical protein WBQ41_14400 [Solirubrobacterales bacterium]
MRRLLEIVAALAALLVLGAVVTLGSASAAQKTRPTDRDQSLRDGCQRPSFLDLTLVNSPEWVYVNHNPSVHVARGVTRVPHPTPVDQPGTHDWFDFNGNLVPDKRYRYLVAGSKAAGANNFARGEQDAGEEYARLHYEWEEGSLPKFAWPSDGDRTALWGSWIWDCGHWETAGRVTGERTEFHPLNAIAVTRKNGARAHPGEWETDAYISSDGTFAHLTEECARRMEPQADGTYGPGFQGCAGNLPLELKHDPASFRQRLAHSYTFSVRAPKRPRHASRLVLRSVLRKHSGRVTERVRRTSRGFSITVTPHTRNLSWGKSYFASWARRRPPGTRLRVTFRKLLIKRADPDPTEGGPDPTGEKIALYLDLNGYWQLVNGWAPSLFAARDNMLIRLNRTIQVTVQRGHGVSLFVMGRECDGPSGVVLFGHFVPRTKPCPYNPTESKISSHNNDDPGTILQRYRSAGAALGTHTLKSRATVFFPHTGRISFYNGVQGEDVYQLTYTVRRVPPSHPGPPPRGLG